MDYPGAFMEYQEAYRIPWSSIEFQEAQWNAKELSRNTKKFVGIPGGVDEQLVQIRVQIQATQS